MDFKTSAPKPDRRLGTAILYLRKGKILADIGTDHAYLPIYAVANGISRFAIASDIGKSPAERARLHVASYGLSDKIKVLCTDGLSEIEKYSPDDIAIFGMGGELIARILSNAEWVKNAGIRLILQPMTSADFLRGFLAENGFAVIGETLSEEDGRLYVTIACEFDGVKRQLSPEEALLGERNIENGLENPLFERLLCKTINTYKNRFDGKSKAGLDTSEEEQVLGALFKIKKDIEKRKGETP